MAAALRDEVLNRRFLCWIGAPPDRAVRPSTLEWLDTAKSYASYANRAGQYDDVARFFEADGD